jgi:hypothetical protein
MVKEMTPENAMFLLQDIYLPALKNESRTTRKVLEAVPPDNSDHRPDPASRSAIDLVRHIALADIRFMETPLTGEFSTTLALPAHVKTPAEIANWYAERFDKNFDPLSKATRENCRFSRHAPNARRLLPAAGPPPYHSSPRTIEFLPALHGRQGAGHLRRELRLRASAQGGASQLNCDVAVPPLLTPTSPTGQLLPEC